MKKRTTTKIGNVFGYLTVIGDIVDKNSRNNKIGKYVLCRCICNNEKYINYRSLIKGKSRSCGCKRGEFRTKPSEIKVGQIFGKLKFTGIEKNINGVKFLEMTCLCGNIKFVRKHSLLRKHTTSCGCFQNEVRGIHYKTDLTGNKYGNLLVTKRMSIRETGKKRTYYECLCNCGLVSCVESTKLTRGRTKTCGNCSNRVNGVSVSFAQLQLKEMIPIRYKPELNFKICTKFADIVIQDHKIVIEYDSWFHHANSVEKDKDKILKFNSIGWKALSIKSDHSLPSRERLIYTIQNLINSDKMYDEIVLDDWGYGPTFKEVLEKKRQNKLLEQGVSNGL